MEMTAISDNLLVGVLVAMGLSMIQYVTSFFARRKTQVDLENLRLQAQVLEAQAAATAALAIEEAKLAAARLVSTALARAKADQMNGEAVLVQKLDALTVVTEQTHINTNSAKVAMERVEQELRNQLKAQETAAATAATASALAVQAAKEIAAKELQIERERNLRLVEQLATLAPPAPPVPGPEPSG